MFSQFKYVLLIENLIFCHGGFKDISHIRDSEIHLFCGKQHAMDTFKKVYPNSDVSKIKIIKVIVSIKPLESEDFENV